jgi:hypothetical protein
LVTEAMRFQVQQSEADDGDDLNVVLGVRRRDDADAVILVELPERGLGGGREYRVGPGHDGGDAGGDEAPGDPGQGNCSAS